MDDDNAPEMHFSNIARYDAHTISKFSFQHYFVSNIIFNINLLLFICNKEICYAVGVLLRMGYVQLKIKTFCNVFIKNVFIKRYDLFQLHIYINFNIYFTARYKREIKCYNH